MFSWLNNLLHEGLTDFQRANKLFVAKRYPKARKLYLKHAKINPKDAPKCYAQIGEICLRTNALDEPKTILGGGARIIFEGDRDSAAGWYRKGLALCPDHIRCLRGLADALDDECLERLEILKQLASIESSYPRHVEVGDIYCSVHNDMVSALEWYTKAFSLYSSDMALCNKLANVCCQLGRSKEAKDWTDLAMQLHNDDA